MCVCVCVCAFGSVCAYVCLFACVCACMRVYALGVGHWGWRNKFFMQGEIGEAIGKCNKEMLAADVEYSKWLGLGRIGSLRQPAHLIPFRIKVVINDLGLLLLPCGSKAEGEERKRGKKLL